MLALGGLALYTRAPGQEDPGTMPAAAEAEARKLPAFLKCWCSAAALAIDMVAAGGSGGGSRRATPATSRCGYEGALAWAAGMGGGAGEGLARARAAAMFGRDMFASASMSEAVFGRECGPPAAAAIAPMPMERGPRGGRLAEGSCLGEAMVMGCVAGTSRT